MRHPIHIQKKGPIEKHHWLGSSDLVKSSTTDVSVCCNFQSSCSIEHFLMSVCNDFNHMFNAKYGTFGYYLSLLEGE